MKQIFFLAVALFAASNALLAQTASTQPYYPLNIGDKWTYRHVDLKVIPNKGDAPKRTTVEVERQEIYEQKAAKESKDPKANVINRVGFILKNSSGGKTTRDHVVVLEDGVYRVTAAGTAMTPPLRFFPFFKDQEREIQVNTVCGNEVVKGTISGRRDKVTVPAGKFDAVAVLFTNNKKEEFERVEVETWFVEKIGMVKQRILQKGHEHALELETYAPKK